MTDARPALGPYLSAIQEAFHSETGTAAALTAVDVHRVRQWHAAAIPLRVILGGLREAMLDWRDLRPPRSLRFAESEVAKALERYRRTHADGPAPSAVVTDVDRYAAADALIVRLGRERTDERVKQALRQGWRVLHDARERAPTPPIDATWRRARAEVFDRLRMDLDQRSAVVIERTLKTRLGSALDAMSPEAAAAHRAALAEQVLAEHFDLAQLLRPAPMWAPGDVDDASPADASTPNALPNDRSK